MTVGPGEYQCALCRGVFKAVLTDAEAMEQFRREFAGVPVTKENLDIVCDACYQKLRASINN